MQKMLTNPRNSKPIRSNKNAKTMCAIYLSNSQVHDMTSSKTTRLIYEYDEKALLGTTPRY